MNILKIRCSFGQTALHVSAQHKQSDILQLLLEAANSTADKTEIFLIEDSRHWTMLHYAAQSSQAHIQAILKTTKLQNQQILQLLLSHDRIGWTPLHVAAWMGKADICSFLLSTLESMPDRWRVVSTIADVKKNIPLSALQYAVESGTPQVTHNILSLIDVNAQGGFNIMKNMGIPLLLLVKNFDTLVIIHKVLSAEHWLELLMQTDAIDNSTFLHYAVETARIRMAHFALQSLDDSVRMNLLSMEDRNGCKSHQHLPIACNYIGRPQYPFLGPDNPQSIWLTRILQLTGGLEYNIKRDILISLIHQSKFSIEEDGKDEFKTSKAFLIEMLLDDCSVQNQRLLAEECQLELESLKSRTDPVDLQDMKNLLK